MSLEILFRMYKNIKYMSFKQTHSFSQRQSEANRVKAKYPDRIPVICEVDPKNQNALSLMKHKYLVPDSLTVGQFMYVIRKQMTLKPEEAVFLMINNSLPPTNALMSRIYRDHIDQDGFLYGTVTGENVFG